MDINGSYYCSLGVTTLKHFVDMGFAPKLLFYTYIPVIVTSILIGGYVLIKSNFSLLSRLLFLVSLSFALWVINIIFAWIAVYAKYMFFVWTITPVFEFLIFSSAVYFSYVFIDDSKADISMRKKIILHSFALPILVFLPTKFDIEYLNTVTCEGVPAFTWFYYLYPLEVISILWIIYICIRKFKSLGKENVDRKKILYFMVGMASFLSLFVGSNVIGQVTSIQEISFIGSLGMVIFIGLLAYLIVKYEAFNIKLLGAHALITAIIALIASQFFFIQNPTNKVLTGITLALVTVFGWWLAKSVKKENDQNESLREMNAIITEQKTKLNTIKPWWKSI